MQAVKWSLFGFSAAIADVLDIIHCRGEKLAELILNVEISADKIKKYLDFLDYSVSMISLDDFKPIANQAYNFGFFIPEKALLLKKLASYQLNFQSLIHPTAVISHFASIGQAAMIGPQAVISATAKIGEFVRLNRMTSVAHDVEIGDFAHIGPAATICGFCKIGHSSFIGAGSVIKDRITIGDHVTIGAGSVVVSDIPDHATALGNPARVVRFEKIINENKTSDQFPALPR